MSEEMKALREQLLRNDKNGYDTLDEAQLAEMEAYCADYKAFLNGEVRYNSLVRANPERAAKLFEEAEEQSKAKYAHLQKLVKLYGSED